MHEFAQQDKDHFTAQLQLGIDSLSEKPVEELDIRDCQSLLNQCARHAEVLRILEDADR